MKRSRAALKALKASTAAPSTDVDVIAEQETLRQRCEAYIGDAGHTEKTGDVTSYAIEMFGLRKTFSRSSLFRRREPFVAVEGNWLGIREGANAFEIIVPLLSLPPKRY